mmetsp:Transcript_39481/g.37932  ORF Transcript_39481/g.37932 Transcript_39481/m.37932 type:complete len:107 (+) Transcript_39481:160-480(+)
MVSLVRVVVLGSVSVQHLLILGSISSRLKLLLSSVLLVLVGLHLLVKDGMLEFGFSGLHIMEHIFDLGLRICFLVLFIGAARVSLGPCSSVIPLAPTTILGSVRGL